MKLLKLKLVFGHPNPKDRGHKALIFFEIWRSKLGEDTLENRSSSELGPNSIISSDVSRSSEF